MDGQVYDEMLTRTALLPTQALLTDQTGGESDIKESVVYYKCESLATHEIDLEGAALFIQVFRPSETKAAMESTRNKTHKIDLVECGGVI